nr:hypothetical protein Iba_chr10bCG4640 [Ipomoea batatas]
MQITIITFCLACFSHLELSIQGVLASRKMDTWKSYENCWDFCSLFFSGKCVTNPFFSLRITRILIPTYSFKAFLNTTFLFNITGNSKFYLFHGDYMNITH